MPDVFVSYSRQDNDFAELLGTRLKAAGIEAWADVDKLPAGVEWRHEIDKAIKAARSLIVVMSPAAKDSDYVTYEWAFALGAGVPVIPVLVRPTARHPRLDALQFLDFSTAQRPWDQLIQRVRSFISKLSSRSRDPEESSPGATPLPAIRTIAEWTHPPKFVHPRPQLQEFIGRKYENQTVTLDRLRLISCEFSNCTIKWDGGPAELINARIHVGCNLATPRFDIVAFMNLKLLTEGKPTLPLAIDHSSAPVTFTWAGPTQPE